MLTSRFRRAHHLELQAGHAVGGGLRGIDGGGQEEPDAVQHPLLLLDALGYQHLRAEGGGGGEEHAESQVSAAQFECAIAVVPRRAEKSKLRKCM